MQSKAPIAIFWFRHDLRLHDNHGLIEACESGIKVLPIFIYDLDILSKLEKDDRRVSFISAQISRLKAELEKKRSSLLVKKGRPVEVISALTKEYQVKKVYCNNDYEPYAVSRDQKVAVMLNKMGIEFLSFKDSVLFEKDEILKKDGSPYHKFTPYYNNWIARFTNQPVENFGTPSLTNFFNFSSTDVNVYDELGFHETNLNFPSQTIDHERIEHYHETRDYPFTTGTSRLGIHLRFGTISVRSVAREASPLNQTFIKELAWREFFKMLLWYYPETEKQSFQQQFDRIEWSKNEDHFIAWQQGRTGFPMVDAGMRELKQTGFMHNRVRMLTANFLTKLLQIDWRWGEAWFARYLLDYDQSSNVGNWQWSAGSGCDAQPYFRIFNPETQLKKFDPEHRYIRKWVPEFGSNSYTKPIIDYKKAREEYLDLMKKSKS